MGGIMFTEAVCVGGVGDLSYPTPVWLNCAPIFALVWVAKVIAIFSSRLSLPRRAEARSNGEADRSSHGLDGSAARARLLNTRMAAIASSYNMWGPGDSHPNTRHCNSRPARRTKPDSGAKAWYE